jgi:hypothetical protein
MREETGLGDEGLPAQYRSVWGWIRREFSGTVLLTAW